MPLTLAFQIKRAILRFYLVLDFADQIKDSLIDLREESETEKFSFVRNCCPMMVAGI